MTKKGEKSKTVKAPKGTWGKILKTVFSCCPVSAPFYVLWTLSAVAASFVMLYALENLVEEVSAAAAGTGSTQIMVRLIAILAVCVALKSDWAVNRLFRNRMCYMLNKKFAPRIMEKYSRLDFYCYEDEEMRNVMHLATDNPIILPVDAFFSAVNGMGAVLSNISVIAYFLTVSVWMALIFGVLVCAVTVFDVLGNREVIKAQWERTPDSRRKTDIFNMFCDKNSVFELKAGGADYLEEKYKTLSEKESKRILAGSLRGMRYNAVSLVLLALWVAGMTLLFVSMMSKGEMTAGVAVTVVMSFPVTLNTAWAIASRFKKSYHSYISAGYVYRLMNFPERKGNGLSLISSVPEVEFDNVWFRYPGTDKFILKGLSFRLSAGTSTSLVGENGSGKSTSVKLLLRLYRPTSGRILLNGKDIWEYREEDYYKTVGAVFQDFARYELPFDENIALCLNPDLTSVKETSFYKSTVAAAGSEKAFIGKRLQGGKDLSGGEWQKLAILRLLYRSPSMMILDEPTASLDARAENEIYSAFERLVQKKTALFISHRMALSRIADNVLVLVDGKVAESGKHDLLIKKEGYYARLFEKQAEWYRDNL